MELIVDIKKKLPEFTLDVSFHTTCSSLGLLGESGSGKSITLKCIAGLVTPDEGKIIVNGKIFFDSDKKINVPIQQRKIGFLFQNYALFPNMPVDKNIVYALSKLSGSQRKDIVDDIIKRMQLEKIRHRYPSELSGGQLQRVAMARALAIDPEVLLLDEPFSALDNHLKDIMVKLMTDTLSTYKGTAIFVTHNMDEAYQLCENLIVLDKGKKKGDGTKEEIFTRPPSLAAVKLTGCKNISSVNKIDGSTIQATDWNCTIRLGNPINDCITHVGLRAHYLELSDTAGPNIYDCWPASYSETRFRRFIFLKLNSPPKDISDYNLIWDLSAEELDLIKEKPYPWKIKIDESKLIIVNDTYQV